jgi:hypothetical protein
MRETNRSTKGDRQLPPPLVSLSRLAEVYCRAHGLNVEHVVVVFASRESGEARSWGAGAGYGWGWVWRQGALGLNGRKVRGTNTA